MQIFARLKKIHDQYCTSMPYNYNIANAMQGFQEMGFEIITYYSVNEIYDDFEFGDILLDGIDQVNYVLKKFDIETLFDNEIHKQRYKELVDRGEFKDDWYAQSLFFILASK